MGKRYEKSKVNKIKSQNVGKEVVIIKAIKIHILKANQYMHAHIIGAGKNKIYRRI